MGLYMTCARRVVALRDMRASSAARESQRLDSSFRVAGQGASYRGGPTDPQMPAFLPLRSGRQRHREAPLSGRQLNQARLYLLLGYVSRFFVLFGFPSLLPFVRLSLCGVESKSSRNPYLPSFVLLSERAGCNYALVNQQIRTLRLPRGIFNPVLSSFPLPLVSVSSAKGVIRSGVAASCIFVLSRTSS